MTLPLLVYALATSAMLALGAAIAQFLLRTSIPGTRFLWASALAGSLLIVAVAPVRHAEPVEPVATSLSATGEVPGARNTDATFASDIPMSIAARLSAALPSWTGRALGVLWATAAVALLGILAVNYRAHRRRALHAPTRVVGGTAVRVSEWFGPAVVGIWPGDIVIPRWLLARPDQEQALVVRHERSHVTAGDPALLFAGCIAAALMPWNPASWYMLARLRLAIEVDCDRRVLREGAAPRAYGALLIELTEATPATRAGAPAFACRTSHLERRIVAMTARPLTHRRTRFVAAAAAAALALVAACQADLPSAAQVESVDANKVEEIVIPRLGIDAGKLVYVVNGVIVDRDAVMSLDASVIESVGVLRKLDGARMVVTTKSADAPPVKEVETPTKKPLLIVDGVISGETELRKLDPDRIENVEVVKGEAAKRLYGDRAENGVIQVTLREGGAKRPSRAPTVILRDSGAVNLLIKRDSTRTPR